MYETETIESQAEVPVDKKPPCFVRRLSLEAYDVLLCEGMVRTNPLKVDFLSGFEQL